MATKQGFDAHLSQSNCIFYIPARVIQYGEAASWCPLFWARLPTMPCNPTGSPELLMHILPLLKSLFFEKKVSTRLLARLIFFSSKYSRHRKCYFFKNSVALLPWFRDCHFDGTVSSNVRYVRCCHGRDCHAESPAGRLHCFKMTKIDPVSPFYSTLWLK